MPMSKSYGVQVAGLHGVGGIGKTMICNLLCKDLFMGFDGRMCHMEFGNDTTEKDKDRLQMVLKQFTNTNNEFLKDLSLDECWSRLKELMQLNMVFLAIDNVSGKSIDEAKKYLEVGYCPGSIVLVTAQALGELKYLSIDEDNCLPIPELDEDEAKALFVYHAKPKNEVDKETLMHCINRCYFS